MIIWWSSVIYLTQTTNKQTIWLSVYWQIPSLGTVSINVALYRVYWQMPSLGTVLVNVAFERVHWQIPSLGTVLVNVAFERMYWQIPSLGTVSINVALCRMYWQIPSLGTVLVIVAFERVYRQIPSLGTILMLDIKQYWSMLPSSRAPRENVLSNTIPRDSIGKCWPLQSVLGTILINVALYRVYWQIPSIGTVLVNVDPYHLMILCWWSIIYMTTNKQTKLIIWWSSGDHYMII